MALTREELHDINIKIPQAIAYLVESSTKLLEEIANLEYERDEYRKKYLNEADLRRRNEETANKQISS